MIINDSPYLASLVNQLLYAHGLPKLAGEGGEGGALAGEEEEAEMQRELEAHRLTRSGGDGADDEEIQGCGEDGGEEEDVLSSVVSDDSSSQ